MAKKILNILNTYKSSINIRDDFRDTEKINSFIPTQKNIALLEEYLDIVTTREQKSVLLSGAYGTGKSYLLSVLLGVLGGKLTAENIAILTNKIKIISPDFAKKLKDLLSKKYIVVFPKDVFKDFKQAITLGINEQIRENKLVLDQATMHKAVLKKIQDWEENHPLFYDSLKGCLQKQKIDIDEYVKKLQEHSPKAFSLFEDLYPAVMGGEHFSPENAIATVPDLLDAFEKAALAKKFDGVIYIFDEFGRYLEQNINNVDVKQVQDAAEYCNSGNKSSLFLITHKEIFQYSRKVEKEDNRHEWEKVSGRFRKEHLVYEEQSINQILQVILKKNGVYDSLKTKFEEDFNKQIKILSCIITLTDKPNEIIDTLYPLNYVAATMLSGLSQKLAQNERTMFSFLCGDERFSLRKIFKNTSDQVDFITADRLYDYFEENFKYLDENEYQYYINAKSIIESLSETEKLEKEIIKTLALLYILNQFSILPPKIEVIAAGIGVEDLKLQKKIDYLKNEGLITNRGDTNKQYYKLVRDLDINVDKEVQKYIQYSMENFDYMETLTKHIPPGYEYAVKYNDEYKITRYLKKYYIDVSNITNFEKKVLSNTVEDGKIVYLFNLQNKQFELNDLIGQYGKEIIFIFPIKKFDIIDNLKELEAVDRLVTTRTDIQSREVVKNEFLQYKQETIELIEDKLNDYLHRLDNVEVYINKHKVDCDNVSEFQDEIKTFFADKYSLYYDLMINYELINKTKLTATIKKARREILTHFSEKTIDQEYFDKTGAENSIARIVLAKTNLVKFEDGIPVLDFEQSNFIQLYNNIIDYLKGDPKTLEALYLRYASNQSTWGLRKGLFSLILGIIIDKHCEDIYISINGDEINVTPELFDKFDVKTTDYNINFIEYTKDKRYFLKEMYSRLRKSVDNHIYEKNQSLAVLQGLRLYIYAQPKLVLQQLEDRKTLSKLLQHLSINNSKEFFFKKVPTIYRQAKDFYEITKLLIDDLDFLEDKTQLLRKELEDIVRTKLNLQDLTLGDALALNGKKVNNEWLNSFKKNIQSYEGDPLTAITEYFNGFDFYNWRAYEDIQLFEKALNQINTKSIKSKANLEHMNGSESKVVLSSTAKLLKSKLQADIKNIGRIVSKDEINSILIGLLQDN